MRVRLARARRAPPTLGKLQWFGFRLPSPEEAEPSASFRTKFPPMAATISNDSGVVVLAGGGGASGRLSFSSGASTAGNAGALLLGSGAATAGRGGAVVHGLCPVAPPWRTGRPAGDAQATRGAEAQACPCAHLRSAESSNAPTCRTTRRIGGSWIHRAL